jgi:hypothetical protein
MLVSFALQHIPGTYTSCPHSSSCHLPILLQAPFIFTPGYIGCDVTHAQKTDTHTHTHTHTYTHTHTHTQRTLLHCEWQLQAKGKLIKQTSKHFGWEPMSKGKHGSPGWGAGLLPSPFHCSTVGRCLPPLAFVLAFQGGGVHFLVSWPSKASGSCLRFKPNRHRNA